MLSPHYHKQSTQCRLTIRERQCLYWAAQDKSVVETAELLFIAPETVKKHRKAILRKMACRTMVAALANLQNSNFYKINFPH